jgi:hypothetical protein
MTAKRIDPKRTYSLIDIAREEILPWGSNIATVRKWVLKDRMSKNKLKAVIVGHGLSTKYYIKGANLIEFIANVEDGSYRL